MSNQNFFELFSLLLVPLLLLFVVIVGLVKKLSVYEIFINGAKDGVKLGFNIIPYLVAIMTAVSMFRASGAIDIISNLFGHFFEVLNIPIDVLPIMLTRSLSGSATLGLLSDVVTNTGTESYASKLAAVMVGSSETTFYVLAVYFGSVGITKFRHAVYAGVLADIFGIVMAIIICKFFFS